MIRLAGIFALLVITPPAMAAGHARTAGVQPASLRTFLEQQGFGGSPLHRRFGNHLFAIAQINGRSGALMIDSGCPFTLIDRVSARNFALTVRETKSTIVGAMGNVERHGVSQVSTLAMGNCTFTHVPVWVASEDQINRIASPHLDGLFGAHEMAKFGMIIDCTRQMVYVNPKGPSAATSEKLSRFLEGRGFSRIPMHFNSGRHVEIAVTVNGHPLTLIVDTGAPTTLLSAPAATATGTTVQRRSPSSGLGVGHVQQLTLGSFRVGNAEITVANVARMVGAGLLGEEYLSWNFGILDLGGMNLYLRPPDRR